MTMTTGGKSARNSSVAPAAQAPGGKLSEGDAQTARLLEQLMQIARISALEEMASGIAHELNQPIGAIATFAQAAERMLNRPEPLVAQAIEVLQHISAEAIGAGAGIRRIRALFDGREGERTTCELAEVVSELRPVLELLASRAGMKLDIMIQPGLPQVSIDRLRIQHVLFTLVQNALELPHEEGTWARVRIELSGDRYSVLTKVIDHGPGVSVEASEQLFKPFFTTKQRGTGLGLASSRAIVEAHEGTIGFENRADGGAEFWFRLPAAAGGSVA